MHHRTLVIQYPVFPEKFEKFCPTGFCDTVARMNARPTIEQTPDHEPPEIPDWMIPQPTREQRAIIEQGRRDAIAYQTAVFELIFDDVLDHVARSEPVGTWFEKDPRRLDHAQFLRWVYKDKDRKNKYREAQIIAAEVTFDQILIIADAEDSMEDIARSTLRVNSRWKKLEVLDRDRFGQKKQIDQNVTIDLGDAMRLGEERARNRVIEGRAERIEE